MARHGYPRPGHRLAPRTLREILQVPVPPGVCSAESPGSLCLGDLDETAWERFDEPACCRLAAEVVKAVGSAARRPIPIAGRRMPPLPPGLRVVDLELEARTLNCLVAAGFHHRPQDLGRMTIEEVLGLRGFWAKSLVDLLTSLEYAIDHSQGRRRGRRRGIASNTTPRISRTYPQRGCRLAPATLKEILMEPVPGHLVTGEAARGLRLCDLDEHLSRQLTKAEMKLLGQLIVARVNVSGAALAIRHRRLPSPPAGMRLEDLPLENRTYNCLARAGFDADPQALGRYTVGQIQGLKAFGAKRLVDLLTSLESLAAAPGVLDGRLTAEAEALGELSRSARVFFDDPRLGKHLRRLDGTADTLAQLAEQIARRRRDPPDPGQLTTRLRQLRQRIEHLGKIDLRQELTEIFSLSASPRDGKIVAAYYGWDGEGGKTLEELGRRYGLSRERIRQVCVRAVKLHRGGRVFAPRLDRTLALVARQVPIAGKALGDRLLASGEEPCWLPPECILRAAEFLGRKPAFAVVRLGAAELVVKPDCRKLPARVLQVARHAALGQGIASVAEIGKELERQRSGKINPALVRLVLETQHDCVWLDAGRNWFRLEPTPYGLGSTIGKVLAVAPRIPIIKLREAIRRSRRSPRKVPPRSVLAAFCGDLAGVRVEDNVVIADVPRDWRKVLSGIEAKIVAVLRRHGPMLERNVLEELCTRKGMNRFSFNAMLMSSPVITQLGRSVYGLVGTRASRKEILALAECRRSAAAAKVLQGHGEADDGRLWLAYRLSKAVISGGVTTVPAAVQDRIVGRFTLSPSPAKTGTSVVAKGGCAWGLGPVLRRQAARPGDFLVLLFDTDARRVEMRLGGEEELARLLSPCDFVAAEEAAAEQVPAAETAAQPVGL